MQTWRRMLTQISWSVVLALTLMLASGSFKIASAVRLQPPLVGPKTYYLALGDSLAYGFQPDFDWIDGYANAFFSDLAHHGVQHYDDLACTDESSTTMIKGGCPYALLSKYLYKGPQLQAAVNYLHAHAGQVSPVTLDIGANDFIPDLNTATCTVKPKWESDLATLDTNLTQIILPQLQAALTVNGQVTGDLLLLNYYDPYQTLCPNTLSYIQTLNQHLQADVASSSSTTLVDIFSAFTRPSDPPTSAVSAPTLCSMTWMCTGLKNIHPTSAGYNLMASTIEHTVNY